MSAPAAESSAWVVDASVAAKWFRPPETEPESALARDAIGQLAMRITSLTLYEIGNLLTREAGRGAAQVGAALDLLVEMCGDPVPLLPGDYGVSAQLARAHGLTFYDASYVAIANRIGRRVLSADGDLLGPGLAVDLKAALG
ncbi:MAG TPA: type II toxin-antitoxin system VapC family toxin [Solirubrobacterales bacterium]|nr:type II toxin-antitoxin system VapC family toxin [Solirubrobacterales bacterium]